MQTQLTRMAEKMHLPDLMRIRKTRYIVAFSCINFELTSIKHKTLNKQGSTTDNRIIGWWK